MIYPRPSLITLEPLWIMSFLVKSFITLIHWAMSFNHVLEEDGLHNCFVKVYKDAIRNFMKFASNFAGVLQSTELSLWPTAKLSTLHSHKNPHQARASNSTGVLQSSWKPNQVQVSARNFLCYISVLNSTEVVQRPWTTSSSLCPTVRLHVKDIIHNL